MESQPQNPEFRNNPENFHPCIGSDGKLVFEPNWKAGLFICYIYIVLYADNLCKWLDPDQDQQNVEPDLDQNC